MSIKGFTFCLRPPHPLLFCLYCIPVPVFPVTFTTMSGTEVNKGDGYYRAQRQSFSSLQSIVTYDQGGLDPVPMMHCN